MSRGTALITGGAQRIGREIALALAEDGFDIALHYQTSQPQAEATAQSIREKIVECYLFQTDLSRQQEVLALMPAVRQKTKNLNILINNASLYEPSSLLDTNLALFHRLLDVNVQAPFLLSREFARWCKGGLIINLLDCHIAHHRSDHAMYLFTKKILATFTQMSAREWGPAVRVNGIAPGLILPPEGEDEDYLDKKAAFIPLQKRGGPTQICQAVKYLVDNDFVTGQILFVDGGEALI